MFVYKDIQYDFTDHLDHAPFAVLNDPILLLGTVRYLMKAFWWGADSILNFLYNINFVFDVFASYFISYYDTT